MKGHGQKKGSHEGAKTINKVKNPLVWAKQINTVAVFNGIAVQVRIGLANVKDGEEEPEAQKQKEQADELLFTHDFPFQQNQSGDFYY